MFGNFCLSRDSPAFINLSFVQPVEDFSVSKSKGITFTLGKSSLLLSASSSSELSAIQTSLSDSPLLSDSFRFNSLLILIQLAAIPG